MVRGHDYDECEWHDHTNKHCSNKPQDASAKQPGKHPADETQDSQWRLHHCRAFVAGSPNRSGGLRIAAHPCRMLHEIDIERGAREYGAAKNSDKLRDVEHINTCERQMPQAIVLTPNS
jgi:hypothetical protein